MTWQCISPGVTVKCCMSNVVNETDDDMLWNVKRMEYWGGGDTDCEGGGSDTDW